MTNKKRGEGKSFPFQKGTLLRPFLIKNVLQSKIGKEECRDSFEKERSEIDNGHLVCKDSNYISYEAGNIIGKVNECEPNDYVGRFACESGNIIDHDCLGNYVECEAGNIIDQMGSIFVMAFMFVMVLVFAGYSKMVMMRINIDTVTKGYLYQMEEEGCLTAEMQQYMKEELRDIGVNYGVDGDAISFAGTSNLGDDQAPYGSRITLQCSMSFPNPMYETIGQEKKGDTWFTIPGLARTLDYTVKMTATSKW